MRLLLAGNVTDQSGTYSAELKLLEPSSQRINVYENPLSYGDFPADVLDQYYDRYGLFRLLAQLVSIILDK